MSERLTELATRYTTLREEKRQLAERTKQINEETDQLEQEILPIMETMGAQNVKLDGVGTVFLANKSYVRVLPEKYEEFVAWLDNNGLGFMAKRTVNPKTLEAQYREWESTDQPLPPEEMVSAFRKTEVHIRKA